MKTTGTPVDAGYAQAISKLISGAAKASEMFSEDELEEFAAAQPAAKSDLTATPVAA